jgi:hypothetical protein
MSKGLNPTNGTGKDKMSKRRILLNVCRELVEHSTRKPKIEGLNLAAITRSRKVMKKKIIEWLHLSSTVVEHLTHISKVDSSNAATGIGRNGNKKNIFE